MSKFEALGMDAELLFVQKDKTLTEIAEIFSLSIQTLSRWKIAGNWDEKRKKYRASPRGTLDILEEVLRGKVEELRDMSAAEVDTKATDSIVKLVASIQKLKKEEDIRVQAINVMSEFGKYVQKSEYSEKEKDMITKVMNGFFNYIREL